jgi:hypothetical protein
MFLPPIADRKDFCMFAERLFKKNNSAIEIGVFAGDFARENLNHWTGEYYLCDAWSHRPEDASKNLWDKNSTSNADWIEIKQTALEATKFAGDRVKVVQGFSTETAALFPDGFFDWIYLDAMHDYNNVKMDMEAWWPKLRDGGLFSGDDYGLSEMCPLDFTMTPDRWAMRYGEVARDPNHKWGTLNALCEFFSEKRLFLGCTWLNDTHNPSWYAVKPD